jgi:hypothetical protein
VTAMRVLSAVGRKAAMGALCAWLVVGAAITMTEEAYYTWQGRRLDRERGRTR